MKKPHRDLSEFLPAELAELVVTQQLIPSIAKDSALIRLSENLRKVREQRGSSQEELTRRSFWQRSSYRLRVRISQEAGHPSQAWLDALP